MLTPEDREALLASRYVSLEVAGCIQHRDHVEGLVPADQAEFLTVYGRDAEGHAFALVDLEPGVSLDRALRFARDLADPVGITASLHPSLFPMPEPGNIGVELGPAPNVPRDVVVFFVGLGLGTAALFFVPALIRAAWQAFGA